MKLSFTALCLAILPTLSLAAPDSDGKYWINSPNISVAFVPYAASISNLLIKDRCGIQRDVVAGWDNATYYTIDEKRPYFGGVVGRYANRIKNASFELGGQTYHVTPNEHPTKDHPDGITALHGGKEGWSWKNFTVVSHTESSVTFSLVDPDGSQGFPGEVVSYVTYAVKGMDWDISMVAVATTKATPIMLSSHAYWNLDGFANNETRTALNHTLYMPYGGQRVGVDGVLVPTGEILSNGKGSVNDFWSNKEGKMLGEGFEDEGIHGNCGFNCTGYDNCWLVNREQLGSYDWRTHSPVATLSSAWSGIKLEVFSDQDAFQVYGCGGQDGSIPVKKTQGTGEFARTIAQYGCVVLEVQDWIDGINHPEWMREEKQIFRPGGDPYVLRASYRFSVD